MKKEDGFPGQISYVLPEKIEGLIRLNLLISDFNRLILRHQPALMNSFVFHAFSGR